MAQLKYGDVERDHAALPPATLIAFAQRGMAHFLGNEQASKLVGKIVTAAELPDDADKTTRKAAIEAFRLSNADTVKAWMDEITAKAVEAMDAGTVGMSTRGPSVDPFTAECQKLAKDEVLSILRANGIKVPKADEVITFANGDTRTWDQMLASRMAKNGPAIEKEARRRVADRAKKAEEAKKRAAENAGNPKVAEDLGL